MVLFDVRKFLKLLAVSNPNSLEWLSSPIYYIKDTSGVLSGIDISRVLIIPNLYRHYLSMGRNNYQKYIEEEQDLRPKRYLYAARGCLNALWVQRHDAKPPLDFEGLVRRFGSWGLKPKMIEELLEIIKIKRVGKEGDKCKKYPNLGRWLERVIATEDPYSPRIPDHDLKRRTTRYLDEIFLQLLERLEFEEATAE